MGFSTTAAFVILFILSLAIVGVAYSTFYSQIKDYVYQLKEEREKAVEKANTKLSIVSISAVGSATTHNLTMVVENTGTTTLNVSKFDLLVDGSLVDFAYNRTVLYPETTVEITSSNLAGGTNTTHRLKLVADNGYAIYATYTVS
ncbi:flagellin [Ferroglobus placidus DSM 10642]|uniref:Flagellin n=1 Tax=Ferroglobus placidus (strain DSM 10642 / AEDII12DO) TaxID=589924 RepID=D3RYP7_FERPA|nr:flagellin [Ferroglobus placidus]ADC65610.1 flagellin [Ferroglobus placidus DSM 10642]